MTNQNNKPNYKSHAEDTEHLPELKLGMNVIDSSKSNPVAEYIRTGELFYPFNNEWRLAY